MKLSFFDFNLLQKVWLELKLRGYTNKRFSTSILPYYALRVSSPPPYINEELFCYKLQCPSELQRLRISSACWAPLILASFPSLAVEIKWEWRVFEHERQPFPHQCHDHDLGNSPPQKILYYTYCTIFYCSCTPTEEGIQLPASRVVQSLTLSNLVVAI